MSERTSNTASEPQAPETEEPQQEDGPGEPERAPSAFLPEPGSDEQTQEALPKARKGERVLIYQGRADVLRHGEHTFRPGQPVVVPSEVAEELLTLPFESFIDAHEAQKAKE